MIHIVTDSTSDLPPEFIQQYSIHVIPLHIDLAGKSFLDGVDFTPDEFYQRIRSTNEFPVTSAPSEDDFCIIYRQFAATDTVFSIHISSKMSQTVEKARRAARSCDTAAQIHVVDSFNASLGLGIVVAAAQRMIQQNLPPELILKQLEQIIQYTQVIFAVPNLDFLKKGGRIGEARRLIGKLLGYKPILGTQDGEIIALHKIKDRKLFPKEIVNLMKQHLNGQNRIYAGVFHVHAEAAMNELKEHVTKTFDCVELISTTAGAVIGSHTGYGAIAVAYYPDFDF